jgi:hypothetical protein
MFEPFPLGLSGGRRSDRHGVIERHPALALFSARKAEDMTAAREVDLRALAEGPASECEDAARRVADRISAKF